MSRIPTISFRRPGGLIEWNIIQTWALKCTPESPNIFLKYFSLRGRMSSKNFYSFQSPKIAVVVVFPISLLNTREGT